MMTSTIRGERPVKSETLLAAIGRLSAFAPELQMLFASRAAVDAMVDSSRPVGGDAVSASLLGVQVRMNPELGEHEIFVVPESVGRVAMKLPDKEAAAFLRDVVAKAEAARAAAVAETVGEP